MIKDRNQKKLAARFCAAQGLVPFTEVVVRSPTGLEDGVANITDIDVMGLDIGKLGRVQRVIFDCKTASKQSGINRALWAGGLKAFVRADRAFVIQVKETPDTHRLAASSFGVHIHTEGSFRHYAASVAPDFALELTYLDDMAIWDHFVTLGQHNQKFVEPLWFASTQAALEQSGPKGIRSGLGHLIKLGGELDPAKPLHQLFVGTYLSGFLIFLALSTGALKDIFQFTMEKESFERRLRYFIWEGRDNYQLRKHLRHAALQSTTDEATAADFDLPEWDRLVELMRMFLDAPEALAPLPLLVKELAFRSVSSKKQPLADESLRTRFKENNRARQFVFAAMSYLTQAAHLPRDFRTMFEAEINSLIEGN